MYEPPSTSPAAQIFSLDVTALSDRLDVTEEELLAGLHRKASPSGEPVPSKRASIVSTDSPPFVPSPEMSLAYVVCLVVSQPTALRETKENAFSVLELSLRRLSVHRHCARIVVCVTDDKLQMEVEEIVRACKRCAPPLSRATATIDILHRDHDAVSAVQYACMYVDATATALSENNTPFVIIRVDSRVFDVATVDELVHQQQNAEILTDGLTSAVVLVDGTKETRTTAQVPVGIWVCSLAALLKHCETSEVASGKSDADRPEDDNDSPSIDAWIPAVLGTLHCETVIANAEFNWEEVRGDSNTLAYRFEPVPEASNQAADGGDHGDSTAGSATLEWMASKATALSAIQAELESDGINAALFPVQTSVVHRESEAPVSSIDMAITPPTTAIDERSPLLSTCSRATTILSDIDLEGTQHVSSTGTNVNAYLIQIERPMTPAEVIPTDQKSTSGPELIFALPDDLTQVLQADASSTFDDLDGLPPLIRVRRRSDRLPSSVTQVTLEAVILDQPQPKLGGPQTRRVSVILHVQKQVPLVGYLILITALFAVSSQGAVLDLLVGVPPLLKLFWRVSGVSIALFPFAALSMYRKGLPQLPHEKRWLALCCVLAYATYNSTFLIALSLTSIGHVYIFANSHSLIMVAGKLLLGEPLGTLELLGAALGFSGGVITTLDHSAAGPSTTKGEGRPVDEPSHVVSPSPSGDLIAFAGAFGGVAYLLSAKKLRAALGVRVFLFLLTTGVALLLLPVLLANHERLGIRLDEPTHATHGLVGWVHHMDIELYLVLVGSVCGTMGFIAALKYFDPLVVSVTMLTEPVVATIISIFMGVERVPGWPTLVGGLAVIAGCLLVLLATHKTSHKIDVSDRLVKTPFTSAASVLRGPDDHERSSRRSVGSSSSSSSSSMRRPSRHGTYGSLA